MSFLKKFFRGIGWIFFIVIALLVLYLVVTQVRVAHYKKIYTKCHGVYGDKECKWNEDCHFSGYAYPMGNCSGEWCTHVSIQECKALPPGKVIHFWEKNYDRWSHVEYNEKMFNLFCTGGSYPCRIYENGKVIQEIPSTKKR